MDIEHASDTTTSRDANLEKIAKDLPPPKTFDSEFSNGKLQGTRIEINSVALNQFVLVLAQKFSEKGKYPESLVNHVSNKLAETPFYFGARSIGSVLAEYDKRFENKLFKGAAETMQRLNDFAQLGETAAIFYADKAHPLFYFNVPVLANSVTRDLKIKVGGKKSDFSDYQQLLLDRDKGREFKSGFDKRLQETLAHESTHWFDLLEGRLPAKAVGRYGCLVVYLTTIGSVSLYYEIMTNINPNIAAPVICGLTVIVGVAGLTGGSMLAERLYLKDRPEKLAHEIEDQVTSELAFTHKDIFKIDTIRGNRNQSAA